MTLLCHSCGWRAATQAVYEACAKAQADAQGGSWMTCLDYLVACTEYEVRLRDCRRGGHGRQARGIWKSPSDRGGGRSHYYSMCPCCAWQAHI